MSSLPLRQIQATSSNPTNTLASPSSANPVDKTRSLSTSSGSGPSVTRVQGKSAPDARQSVPPRPRAKSSPKPFQGSEKHSKTRLNHLFAQINKEFEGVLAENAALRERIEELEEIILGATSSTPADGSVHKVLQQKLTSQLKRDSMVAASQLSQKIKSTYKLKASGKIFNKIHPTIRSELVGRYELHKDGVWFVTCTNRFNKFLVATASAGNLMLLQLPLQLFPLDGTACVADLTTPVGVHPLVTYVGHQGSVNCVKFHPKYDLLVTASGDCGAHIWRPNFEQLFSSKSESDEKESPDESSTIRTPRVQLTGHSNVVIACDFMSTVDQCVTASWDRSANLYDIHTGEMIVQLLGHDQELTDVAAHSSAPLVVTSSHDSTFRLWDFREAIHSVSVFQGHSERVNSASFLGSDKVVSGSDDRTVKVWDIKNMRSPLTNIQFESPINKIGISQNNLMAIPLDNRNVRIYDANGTRLCRLPRNEHERMVTCAAFGPISPTAPSTHVSTLVTSAFDRRICSWLLSPPEKV